MKDKIFGVLQRVGRSFMLPIAILPVAGLLLGIGSSFHERYDDRDVRTDSRSSDEGTLLACPAGDHEQCRKCGV